MKTDVKVHYVGHNFPKRCGCGKSYTVAAWRRLELCGMQGEPETGVIELRHCTCGSTLAVDVAPVEPLGAFSVGLAPFVASGRDVTAWYGRGMPERRVTENFRISPLGEVAFSRGSAGHVAATIAGLDSVGRTGVKAGEAPAGETRRLNVGVAFAMGGGGAFTVRLSKRAYQAYLVWLDGALEQGLGGTPAEHATEFQHARHDALEAVNDAAEALKNGQCLVAGKRIDDAYGAHGRMQAHGYSGVELADASRVLRELKKVDGQFESKCVRAEPREETERKMAWARPGLASAGHTSLMQRLRR